MTYVLMSILHMSPWELMHTLHRNKNSVYHPAFSKALVTLSSKISKDNEVIYIITLRVTDSRVVSPVAFNDLTYFVSTTS